MTLFWPSGQRCQKFAYILKVTSSCRAKIQNMQNFVNSTVLNFSSATSGHFSNVKISGDSVKKNTIQIFERRSAWSSSTVIEGNMQRGSDFLHDLQHKCLLTLTFCIEGIESWRVWSTSWCCGGPSWNQSMCNVFHYRSRYKWCKGNTSFSCKSHLYPV